MNNPGHFFDIEHRVNGYWNTRLTLAFPLGAIYPVPGFPFESTWFIAPEAFPTDEATQDLKADLLVSRIISDKNKGYELKPAVHFEGKSKGKNLANAKKQVEEWFKHAKLTQDDIAFAITAVDRSANFYAWKPKVNSQYLVPLKFQGNQIVELKVTEFVGGYDVVEHNDVVHMMMLHMEAELNKHFGIA
jgi:hypothetical protein